MLIFIQTNVSYVILYVFQIEFFFFFNCINFTKRKKREISIRDIFVSYNESRKQYNWPALSISFILWTNNIFMVLLNYNLPILIMFFYVNIYCVLFYPMAYDHISCVRNSTIELMNFSHENMENITRVSLNWLSDIYIDKKFYSNFFRCLLSTVIYLILGKIKIFSLIELSFNHFDLVVNKKTEIDVDKIWLHDWR